MSLIIQRGRELLRINTLKNHIQYSTDSGRNWLTRYTGSYPGTFIDLFEFGSEILACTSKGLFVSRDDGRNWQTRYAGNYCGTFQQLASDGNNILATTSKGLFISRDGGRNWNKR